MITSKATPHNPVGVVGRKSEQPIPQPKLTNAIQRGTRALATKGWEYLGNFELQVSLKQYTPRDATGKLLNFRLPKREL